MKIQMTILVLALLASTLVESCFSPVEDCKRDKPDGDSCSSDCDCASEACTSGTCGPDTNSSPASTQAPTPAPTTPAPTTPAPTTTAAG